MANLISKPFYEGAPLDPNKLNDMLTDITTTFGEAALANKTVNGLSESFYIVYDCGRENITKLPAGKATYTDIVLENSSFDTSIVTTNPIVVVASISTYVSGASASGLVKTSGGGTKFMVGAISSVALDTVNIDWIAIQKVPSKNA